MRYTVVFDEQERARQLENRLNAVARHCKIGRVRYRREIGYGWPSEQLPKPLRKNTYFTDPYLPYLWTGRPPVAGMLPWAFSASFHH